MANPQQGTAHVREALNAALADLGRRLPGGDKSRGVAEAIVARLGSTAELAVVAALALKEPQVALVLAIALVVKNGR